jgi:hypothetical protein
MKSHKQYLKDYGNYSRNGIYKLDDGSLRSFKNDLMHKIDGPAYVDRGSKLWYYEGKLISCSSQEEFERLLKLKAFW